MGATPHRFLLVIEQALLSLAAAVAIRITASEVSGVTPTCPISNSCVRVLTSSISSVFGIPLSVFGLLVVVTLILFHLIDWDRGQPPQWPSILLTVLLLIACLSLQSYSVFWLRSVCALCLTFCTASALGATLIISRRKKTPVPGGIFQLAWLILCGLGVAGVLALISPSQMGSIRDMRVVQARRDFQTFRYHHLHFGGTECKKTLYDARILDAR